jgi:ribosome-binding ATPase YchF (GTP1/OBG family)
MDELRAWTIQRGMTAIDAAGSIHTDMAQGFIRAETIHWSELVEVESLIKAKEKGLLRLEGKGYLVQDGDILTIRFSV